MFKRQILDSSMRFQTMLL